MFKFQNFSIASFFDCLTIENLVGTITWTNCFLKLEHKIRILNLEELHSQSTEGWMVHHTAHIISDPHMLKANKCKIISCINQLTEDLCDWDVSAVHIVGDEPPFSLPSAGSLCGSSEGLISKLSVGLPEFTGVITFWRKTFGSEVHTGLGSNVFAASTVLDGSWVGSGVTG